MSASDSAQGGPGRMAGQEGHRGSNPTAHAWAYLHTYACSCTCALMHVCLCMLVHVYMWEHAHVCTCPRLPWLQGSCLMSCHFLLGRGFPLKLWNRSPCTAGALTEACHLCPPPATTRRPHSTEDSRPLLGWFLLGTVSPVTEKTAHGGTTGQSYWLWWLRSCCQWQSHPLCHSRDIPAGS